jgi:hypothetical protein
VPHSLSSYELQLACDAEILLAKNRVIETVYTMFGALAEDYKVQLGSFFLPSAIANTAKISRGENYNGLPYVMLDYPRQFSKTDVFAIEPSFGGVTFLALHCSCRVFTRQGLPKHYKMQFPKNSCMVGI